jgi:selenoprotein S
MLYFNFFSDILEPDVVAKRQEALAAARLRMQEELNAQVEKHKEKLRQVGLSFTL